MDLWHEGCRRFVERGKAGFVDGNGEKIIPARYIAADPFHHGYATIYTGNWRTKYTDGGEHAVLEAADATAQTHIINLRGETVRGSTQPLAPADINIGGRYYPYPFKHSPFEQYILAKLAATPALAELALYDYTGPRDGLVPGFAITARPDRIEPYYRLSAYIYDKERRASRDDEMSRIIADRDGRLYFRAWGEDTPIPLKDRLRAALADARADMMQRRDRPRPYRFNAVRRLLALPLQWF